MDGDNMWKGIKQNNLSLGGPPVHAWPRDAKTSVVRDGSRLNEILVIRLDPAELDDDTRARAVDGIVAYSAVCTHAGCPVTGWIPGSAGNKDLLQCFCPTSEFHPRAGAPVVFAPAPRRRPAPSLSLLD